MIAFNSDIDFDVIHFQKLLFGCLFNQSLSSLRNSWNALKSQQDFPYPKNPRIFSFIQINIYSGASNFGIASLNGALTQKKTRKHTKKTKQNKNKDIKTLKRLVN